MQEDWFHRMLAPDPPEREISLEGARFLAETYRGLVGVRHERVVASVGQSRACPLDLHQLVPVPEPILRRGPDDPASLRWLSAMAVTGVTPDRNGRLRSLSMSLAGRLER